MPQHPDITGPADVQRLIAAFYAKARYDPALAHFFTHVDWAHHTPRIEAFWNTLLFGTQSYVGDPMSAHIQLHQRLPMAPAHFTRWVELFSNTVDELFAGPKAEEAKQRAGSIAGVMVHKVGKHTG
jgi:hemoglobin